MKKLGDAIWSLVGKEKGDWERTGHIRDKLDEISPGLSKEISNLTSSEPLVRDRATSRLNDLQDGLGNDARKLVGKDWFYSSELREKLNKLDQED